MIIKDGKFIIYYENGGRVVKGSSLFPDDLEFVLEKEGYVEVDVYPGTSFLIPCCNGFFDEEIELTKFYEMFEVEGFIDMLKGVLPDIHRDKANLLITIAKEIRSRQFVTDKIEKYVYQNPEANRVYKEQQPPKGFVLPFNKTLKQREPHDKLFLQLPDDLFLKNLELGNEVVYPSISDIFDPYPSILYRTPFIEPIYLSTGSNRKDLISMAINTLKAYHLYQGGSLSKEISTIETSGVKLEHILGDEMNDNLGIQDNEKDFYEACKSWIVYHTGQHLRKKNPNFSEEQLVELVEVYLERGSLPTYILEFFNTMIMVTVRYLYSHSSEILFSLESYYDSLDDSIEQPPETIEFIDLIGRKDKKTLSGETTVLSFISTQARQYGYLVWVESLIKLLRWGSRKPRNLVVPSDTVNSLDLKTFKMSTKTLDISSLERVKLESGKYARVVGLAPGQVLHNGEMRETSVILITETVHVAPKTGESFSNYQHIYLGDVVEAYLADEDFIDGIKFENGSFVIDDETIDQVDAIEMDCISNFKPYLTSIMVQTASEKGLNGLITSSTMLIEPKKYFIYLKQYLNIEKEMNVGSAEVRSQIWYGSRLAQDFLDPHFFSEDFNYYVLSDMLNYYLFSKETRQKQVDIPTEEYTKSNVFSSQRSVNMSLIVYKGDKTALTWQPLVSTKEIKEEIDPQTQQTRVDKKVVGFININTQTKQLIVASLNDGVNQTIGSKPVMLAPVYQWMVDALLIANGLPSSHAQRLQVISENSLTDIMSLRLV